jgi:hypothetical protein
VCWVNLEFIKKRTTAVRHILYLYAKTRPTNTYYYYYRTKHFLIVLRSFAIASSTCTPCGGISFRQQRLRRVVQRKILQTYYNITITIIIIIIIIIRRVLVCCDDEVCFDVRTDGGRGRRSVNVNKIMYKNARTRGYVHSVNARNNKKKKKEWKPVRTVSRDVISRILLPRVHRTYAPHARADLTGYRGPGTTDRLRSSEYYAVMFAPAVAFTGAPRNPKARVKARSHGSSLADRL